MSYEWDPAKAQANFVRPGVEFAEVTAAFEDDLAFTLRDPSSEDEDAGGVSPLAGFVGLARLVGRRIAYWAAGAGKGAAGGGGPGHGLELSEIGIGDRDDEESQE
jgi:hypothetical protein